MISIRANDVEVIIWRRKKEKRERKKESEQSSESRKHKSDE